MIHDGKRIRLYGGRLWDSVSPWKNVNFSKGSGGPTPESHMKINENLQFLNPHSSLTRPLFVLFYSFNKSSSFLIADPHNYIVMDFVWAWKTRVNQSP
jgi:hypothetical protein